MGGSKKTAQKMTGGHIPPGKFAHGVHVEGSTSPEHNLATTSEASHQMFAELEWPAQGSKYFADGNAAPPPGDCFPVDNRKEDLNEENSRSSSPDTFRSTGLSITSDGDPLDVPLSPEHDSAEPMSVSKSPEFTRINGKGIWHSWTRNFKTPLLAFLDLLDNSLDASLKPGFPGKIHVERADPFTSHSDFSGLCLTNNSFKPIRPLRKVLEVYNSTKVGSEESIGENGVGLKQGCATLSDLSFVLTRNNGELSLGIIAAELQLDEGCRLPSFTFTIDEKDDLIEQQETIKEQIFKISESDAGAMHCISVYGRGSVENGVARLVRHYFNLLREGWGEHSFRLVMTHLKHGPSQYEQENNVSNRRSSDPANIMMEQLQLELPKNYIHVPPDYDFVVGGQKVQFCYWQRRLVELTKFEVQVDPDRLLYNYDRDDHSWKAKGYNLKIYAGFDVCRLMDGDDSTCSLYIYSRSSGRLIKNVADARNDLGLVSSGSDFSQGMTVIVDDAGGKLPLSPTKQDLAFGERQNGEYHRSNLFSWIGGVSHLFWTYHNEKLGGRKSDLTIAIKKHFDNVRQYEILQEASTPMLNEADLSTFSKIQWMKQKLYLQKKKAVIRMNKKYKPSFDYKFGADTRFRVEMLPPQQTSARKKRKIESAAQHTNSSSGHTHHLSHNNVSVRFNDQQSGIEEGTIICHKFHGGLQLKVQNSNKQAEWQPYKNAAIQYPREVVEYILTRAVAENQNNSEARVAYQYAKQLKHHLDGGMHADPVTSTHQLSNRQKHNEIAVRKDVKNESSEEEHHTTEESALTRVPRKHHKKEHMATTEKRNGLVKNERELAAMRKELETAREETKRALKKAREYEAQISHKDAEIKKLKKELKRAKRDARQKREMLTKLLDRPAADSYSDSESESDPLDKRNVDI